MAESDVAKWHRMSGLPDNVTDDGEVISRDLGLKTQSEKMLLRAAIARIRDGRGSQEARDLVRLAASYLLAGDVETARRYVERAERCAEERRYRHRPADQSHHAQAKPDARLGVTPRLELARRLRADLPGEGRRDLRGFLWLVIHVEIPRSDAGIRLPVSP